MKLLGWTLVAACIGSAAEAYVAPIKIEALIEESPVIVIAEVVDVTGEVKERVATLAVRQTLKGQVGDTVRLWASSTWTCDISHAVRGERALFFLTKENDAGLRHLAHAGRGRMPISARDGADLVSFWWRDVLMPLDVGLLDGGPGSLGSELAARLADVVAVVQGRPTSGAATRRHFKATFAAPACEPDSPDARCEFGEPVDADALRCRSRKGADEYRGCSLEPTATGGHEPARDGVDVVCRPSKWGHWTCRAR